MSSLLSRRKLYLTVIGSGILALIAVFFAITCGSTTWLDNSVPWEVLWQLRAPRAILAFAAGAALACSGAALQAILRNPLADPYVMGVSGGAALGGTVAIILGAGLFLTPLAAFGGALLAVILALWLTKRLGNDSMLTLLLTGVIINAFTSSAITLLKVLVSAAKAQELLLWLMGSLGYPSWPQAIISLTIVSLGGIALMTLTPALNGLALGDEVAQTLGINVKKLQYSVFILTSLIVASVVSLVGMIGFIGLCVPHLLRMIIGSDLRVLLPTSFFAGATLLLLADTASRLAFALVDTSLPVGVITSFLGAPFFLWLLARSRSIQH